jgi:2-iminobutanoate/2-iminopropanoate deaminase
MLKEEIRTPEAPLPLGSYSQGVRRGDHLYLSGQCGFDPVSRELVSEEAGEQTRQALRNLRSVIEAAGGKMSDLVTVRVHISSEDQWPEVNAAYGDFFEHPFPARTTVAAGLGSGIKVEIDGIAVFA